MSVHLQHYDRPSIRLVRMSMLVAFLALLTFPFLVMVSTALKSEQEVAVLPPTWIPQDPQPQNFLDVWTYVPLAQYFLNSFIVAGGAMLLNAVAAIPAGFALARLRFAGRSAILLVVIATQMFSPIVMLIASFQMMTTLRLVNTYWSLILLDATVTLPFTIWMMTAYFSTIPDEIEEAATLDGSGRFRQFIDHFLPLSVPGIVTVMTFSFVIAWNEFVFALTFISNQDLRPLTTGIYSFVGRYDLQWQYLMAASILSIVPVFLLFLLVQRRLVSGLTAGAVK
ncbi:MAG: carbohydrate ABC transporter permease [Chloroflexota bacterium]